MKGNIFIKRPVMAISISVLILAIGLISLFTLPVEQYPDIAPPTVYVSASYTGADAEAVMNSVIMPLEESINGVEDMMYITSSASNAGLAIIQVYFKQGTDPDMAAVNVQNRVAKAQGLLPAEVTKVGVSTMKRQTSFLQIGALVCTDGRYDQTFLANYLDINIIPQIKRIEGVGDVMELGDTYSMRIWLKPERMAQYGLVPSDITGVLGEQNIEAPTGSLGESSQNVFQFTMKYRGRLKSVEEFQNTVVRSREDGSILRLKDVADVSTSYGGRIGNICIKAYADNAGTSIGAVENIKAVRCAKNAVRISWGKTAGAKGYEIYQASSKNGTYKKIAATTSTKYKIKTTSKKSVYYKVRAYKTTQGIRICGNFSGSVAVKR